LARFGQDIGQDVISPASTVRSIATPAPLLALSLLQPWPWLIFYGEPAKDVENRTWRLPRHLVGRRVAIAASARHDEREFDAARELIRNHANVLRFPEAPIRYPYGAIIGTVELAGCVTESASPWFDGPYGFVLRDPRLRFWTVPPKIARVVRAQERRAA
jgi:hypothetical protein